MHKPVAVVLSLLALVLAGCPEPLAPEDRWVPVKGADATGANDDDPEAVAQRERVRQLAMEARVKKMRAAFVSDEEASCKSDDDCELTAYHCCNCSAGGRMAAVSKSAMSELLRRRGVVCAEYACAQVVSDDPTCAAERAVCREGKCVPDAPASTAPEGIGVEPIPEAP